MEESRSLKTKCMLAVRALVRPVRFLLSGLRSPVLLSVCQHLQDLSHSAFDFSKEMTNEMGCRAIRRLALKDLAGVCEEMGSAFTYQTGQ
jgi:hypothetical protein